MLTRRGNDEVTELDDKKADDKTPPLKLESAELETPTLAPKVENTEDEGLLTSVVVPKQIAWESEKQEKVTEIQSTLLSAGWRSRRAASTRSKEGENPKDSNRSDSPDEAASETNAEESQPQKRRGRPSKNRDSGKAAFYGAAPRTRLEATIKPEPVDGVEQPILVLDSDTEDSSDRPITQTIAQRLRRRVT